MKVHIYTDIDNLFGKACRLWMDVLLAAGHEVEYIDLGMATSGALPGVGQADVNLIVAGIYAFERFGKEGLPRGANLLWMLDPLTRNPEAAVHGYKAALFDAFAHGLDAVLAMDESIEGYLRLHCPGLPVFRLPYLMAERHIRPPLPASERDTDIIFMGGKTPEREHVEQLLAARPMVSRFVWSGLWGAQRDTSLRRSRISLAIHADSRHRYFDQFRTLEAWAAGTVVVCEDTADLRAHGIAAGIHLAMAPLDRLPEVCEALLADDAARARMTAAAQSLLRERFSVESWRARMLDIVTGLA